MSPRKPRSEHVVAADGGKTYRCLRCGAEAHVELPMEISVWIAAAAAFVKSHTCCKPPEKEPK
jgi:hypothetical protein